MTSKSPVYDVKSIPIDKIRANAYNPNSVAPPEMKLLELSIWEDGYTMPIVCYYLSDEDVYEIVDGFHRYQVMRISKRIHDRENGHIPVVTIDRPISNRMASTIRHNRARGSHSIELMTNIVKDLVESRMSELGRALRLRSRDAGATVHDWERGKSTISGPVSVAVEMMLAGAMPPDRLDEIIKYK